MIEIIKILFWLSSGLIIYSYLLYPLLLAGLNFFKPKKKDFAENFYPRVSIIICAYNEEKVIQKRIENCLALNYPRDHLEVIIASDGSVDTTADIVKRYQHQGVILFDYASRRGKVNVLNETVNKASYEILVFSDANAMFHKDAVKNLARHFSNDKIGCVCGKLEFFAPEESSIAELEGFYWKYETLLKTVEGSLGSLLGANGAIYAVRRELFYQCPADTIVEDFVVPMKILEKGYQVVYDLEAIAFEETTKHIIQEKERRIRIGAGDFQALFLLPSLLNPFKGFPSLAFWSHKVLRWFAPFFLILAFVLNLILIEDPFYKVLFILQCSFYGCALIGQVLSWAGMKVKIFNLCYYFVSMNLALFLGFFKFVAGKQKVAWERTER